MNALRPALLASLLFVAPIPGHAQEERAVPKPAPAPAPAPVPTPTPAPTFTVTETTFSVLEPAGDACEWAQVDPLTSARRVLARLAVSCQGGTTALSRDGSRGVARFWRFGLSAPVVGRPTFPEPFPTPAFRDRIFLVELATGAVQELSLPPLGELVEFGFDAEGRLLGLTVQKVTPAQERAGRAEVEGTLIPLDAGDSGHPLLAHAFAWRGGGWTRLDSQATRGAAGVGVLAVRKTLGERSSRVLDPRFTPGEVEDDALLDQLYTLTPEQPDGEWALLVRGGATLAVWGTPFGDSLLATGLLRRVEKHKAVPLPGQPFRENDLVGVQTRGPFLLVSLADSGAHPRLFRGKKLVWSSDSARAVTFWPR